MASSSSLVPLMVSLSLALLVCISQAGADIQPNAVGQADIAKSIAAVQSGINTVKSSKVSGDKITTCLKFLNDSINNLNGAAAALKAGNINFAKAKASAALEDVSNCDDQFEGSGAPQVRVALRAASTTIIKIIQG